LIKSVVTAALAFVTLMLAAPLSAQDEAATQPLPGVIAVRVSNTVDRARLVFDLNFQSEFAIVSLDQPNRIAIDVRAAGLMFTETDPPGGTGLVASYDVEMAEPGRARTTLVLSATAQVQQAYFLEPFADQPARLVVDLIPATAEEFAAHVATDLANSEANKVAIAPEAPTEPGGSNIVAETRPLVVIDPGHGGVDGGAEAPGGLKEKDIVLAFALKLQALLVESGRFDVALTREDDSFLRLEDRVALARENKADLFISIHADSFRQPEIRGASVYTRDENATDELDKVLAEEENKSDLIAGFAVPEMDEAVVDILVDLMRRAMRKESFMAAQAIVHQLEPSVTLRRFPVRQADFFVLQAPDIPSVLVELGFLSNTEDIANLNESDWQQRTAEALARGISSYFDGIQVAQQ
jgi:N-acetylmuramoyl-L-alanine amidase